MKKILYTTAMCLALNVTVALAHHPAEDMVDEEVYAMINDLVADTPHATLVFDEVMGVSVITTPSVSSAEDMVNQGLLADFSLIDGDDVIITMQFSGSVSEITTYTDSEDDPTANQNANKWAEQGEEWGGAVIITINRDLTAY
jgi:hypothetical protein